MKTIPMEYKLSGKPVGDDAIVKKCIICHDEFAIPKTEYSEDYVCCDDCKPEYIRQENEAKIAAAKASGSEAMKDITTALGK